jgi:hypothetical protein
MPIRQTETVEETVVVEKKPVILTHDLHPLGQ